VRLGEVRIDGDCLVQYRDRLLKPTEFVQNYTQAVVGICLTGIERQCPVKLRQCLVVVADSLQHDAQVAVGVRICGIESDGLPV